MAQICLKCKKVGWNYILIDWHQKLFLCWKCFKKIYPPKELRKKVIDKTLNQIKGVGSIIKGRKNKALN